MDESAGLFGSAGQPLATNAFRVIHWMAKPFGAPDAPAVTSKSMRKKPSRSSESEGVSSACANAEPANASSSNEAAKMPKAVRLGTRESRRSMLGSFRRPKGKGPGGSRGEA